jgi:hypothetical protein
MLESNGVYIVLFAFLIGLCFYYYGLLRFEKVKPWQHYFEGQRFSAEEFYQKIETALKEKELEGVSYAREYFTEVHMLSARREYLRISREELVYFVCVAPFSTGTFVSWWQCEKRSMLLHKIPTLAKLLGKNREYKTFYQIDTEAMYTSVVHNTITKLLDEQLKQNGSRVLTEFEKQFNFPQK